VGGSAQAAISNIPESRIIPLTSCLLLKIGIKTPENAVLIDGL